MFAAFQLVGHRPEMLKGIVSEIALELGEAASLGELLKRGAQGFRDRIWGEIESDYSALTGNPACRAGGADRARTRLFAVFGRLDEGICGQARPQRVFHRHGAGRAGRAARQEPDLEGVARRLSLIHISEPTRPY